MVKDIWQTTGVTSEYRLAAQVDPNNFPSNRARFIENVDNNRSNPRLLIFTRREEAIAWLHMEKNLDVQIKSQE